MVPTNPRNDCVTMAVYSLSASTLPLLRKSLFRLVIRSLLFNFRAPTLRQFCSKGFLMTPAWKHSFLALAIVFVILALGSLIPPAMAQANVEGQWQTLPTLAPINPIHLAMLHNGNVLIVSGSGDLASDTTYMAGVWDPATDTITTQPVSWDMFCNGMIILPDGRPFIMGGTLQYNPSFLGVALTSAYDPGTGNFYNLQSMAHGRWYPSSTVLGNGQVMTFSGLTETGETDTAVEIYTVGSGWSTQYTASWTPPLYPRMTLLSNGNVFFSGSTPEAWTFDPATQVWTYRAVHELWRHTYVRHDRVAAALAIEQLCTKDHDHGRRKPRNGDYRTHQPIGQQPVMGLWPIDVTASYRNERDDFAQRKHSRPGRVAD